MKKLLVFLTIVVVFMGLLVFSIMVEDKTAAAPQVSVNGQPAQQTKKIAVNLPLTGNLADAARRSMCAARMALAEEESKGLKNRYQLIIEDDGLNIRNVNNIANKFINLDKADALVSFFGGQVIAGYAEKAGIPHFSALADPDLALKNRFTFTDWVLPDEYSAVLADYLLKKEVKSVALLSLNHQGGDAIVRGLIEKLKETGIRITDNDKFAEDEKFFRMVLEKQKINNPDRYIILAFPPAIDLIGKEAEVLGIKDKLTSVESFGYTDNKALFEGLDFVSVCWGNNGFMKKFKQFCGEDPLHGNNYVYDMIKLAIKALENSNDSAEAVNSLKNKNFDFSMPIYIDEHKIVHSTPVMRTIHNGKPVDYKE